MGKPGNGWGRELAGIAGKCHNPPYGLFAVVTFMPRVGKNRKAIVEISNFGTVNRRSGSLFIDPTKRRRGPKAWIWYAFSNMAHLSGIWIKTPPADSAVVFVHGFLSSSEGCWRSKEAFWPQLLAEDELLPGIGVYSFNYPTNAFSGSFSIDDIVDNFNALLNNDGLLTLRTLIFVCHSMGGLVVRQFLVRKQGDLISKGLVIGLCLVASPSLGSVWANILSPIARLLGLSQGKLLRFGEDNEWLDSLDRNFQELKGQMDLHGKELLEDKFILVPWLIRTQVVQRFSGGRDFRDSLKIPDTNHWSIAKPSSRDAYQYKIIRQFILETIHRRPQRRQGLQTPVGNQKRAILICHESDRNDCEARDRFVEVASKEHHLMFLPADRTLLPPEDAAQFSNIAAIILLISPVFLDSRTCLRWLESVLSFRREQIIVIEASSCSWRESLPELDNAIVLPQDGGALRSDGRLQDSNVRECAQGVALAIESMPTWNCSMLRPRSLAYLCDRQTQETDFEAYFERRNSQRPFVFVVPGCTRESHAAFLERLRVYSLKRVLQLDTGLPEANLVYIEWPSYSKTNLVRNCRAAVATALSCQQERIETVLEAESQLPLVIVATLSTEGWSDGGAAVLEAFLDMWRKWPDVPPNRPLLVALMVDYLHRECQPNTVPPWIHPAVVDDMRAAFAALDKSLVSQFEERFSGGVLSELRPIPQEPAFTFGPSQLRVPTVRVEEWNADIRRVYARYEASALPMANLKPELDRLISKYWRAR